MRESEMRQRIEGFLKRRMQGMLAPALGLGLALGGCGGTEYMAQFPRSEDGGGGNHDGVGLSHDTPIYSAPVTPDLAAADTFTGKDTLPLADDGALDLAMTRDTNALVEVAPSDVAPIIDTGKDSAAEAAASSEAHPGMDVGTGVDAGVDLGNMGTKYMAQLPDAGRDLGATPLYLAQLPDANRALHPLG